MVSRNKFSFRISLAGDVRRAPAVSTLGVIINQIHYFISSAFSIRLILIVLSGGSTTLNLMKLGSSQSQSSSVKTCIPSQHGQFAINVRLLPPLLCPPHSQSSGLFVGGIKFSSFAKR